MDHPVEPVTASAATDAQRVAHVRSRTDKYFSKSRAVVEKFGDRTVTYGVFMRRRVLCAVDPAIAFLEAHYPADAPVPLVVRRLYAEGAAVPDQKPLFTYTGSFAALVELETLLLQRIGFACVSAYNAWRMAMNLPKAAFLDMHARHATGDDMSSLAAYGAAVGSRIARLSGAMGFVGTSQDVNAHHYGGTHGLGTMPHALVGYAGSTLAVARLYAATHPGESLTVLVDFYAREYTDALEVCRWWFGEHATQEAHAGKTLSFRIDTHGDRFAEGLGYERSVEIVCQWLHVVNEYEAVRQVMGEEAFDADSINVQKDRVRRVLFGTGVSAAAIIHMRQRLDAEGFTAARIVGSSGFDLFKCKMFGNARVPVDVIGTGSFLPETLGETFATADIFRYDGVPGIKVGREKIFQGL